MNRMRHNKREIACGKSTAHVGVETRSRGYTLGQIVRANRALTFLEIFLTQLGLQFENRTTIQISNLHRATRFLDGKLSDVVKPLALRQ
jgi:hypothetical protein